MGANVDYRLYETFDRQKVARLFEDDVDVSQSEDGNSYSGCIGMLHSIGAWVDKQFPSVREAEHYLAENHEKWENAWAVSYVIGKPLTATQKKKQEELSKQASELFDAPRNIELQALADIRTAKSDFIGCKGCGSKLKREHIRMAPCPLCHASLLSATVVKRIEAAKDKHQKACDKVNALENKPSGKMGWLVGGWCSS